MLLRIFQHHGADGFRVLLAQDLRDHRFKYLQYAAFVQRGVKSNAVDDVLVKDLFRGFKRNFTDHLFRTRLSDSKGACIFTNTLGECRWYLHLNQDGMLSDSLLPNPADGYIDGTWRGEANLGVFSPIFTLL